MDPLRCLAALGRAVAAIAIDPGQIKGVKPLPFAQIRSGLPVLSRPGNKKRAVTLTKKQFRYGFGNALSESESGELFDKWAIPGPGKPRGHSLVLDHGWREIADLTLSWLARQDL